ncbi:MAG: glycosyltransferase family 4 protein [Chloroflexota bacterium]|nr:glycosyltransferase family 4 protein [Chloroflexota bacterium]
MRILFVHNALRSFVLTDREILASRHEIDELDLSDPRRIVTLPGRLQRADLVYSWFAGLHALGPTLGAALLRKRSIVLVGGYDTARLPEIGYGHMGHPLKRHTVRSICRLATALITFSHAAAREVRRNVGRIAPLHVIYQGFEVDLAPSLVERSPIVLSVGNISRESLKRKGHDVFIRAAAQLPEAEFILVGQEYDDAGTYLRSIAPPNARLAGFLSRGELQALLRRSSVYVQASAHEGFGCALAEAMAAGCLPVVSTAGSLPEVAGTHGVRIETVDAGSVAKAVRVALSRPVVERVAAAESIRERFSLQRRRDELLDLVTTIAR